MRENISLTKRALSGPSPSPGVFTSAHLAFGCGSPGGSCEAAGEDGDEEDHRDVPVDAIGMFTPPFGLNLFVSQALFKAPMTRVVRGLVPFIVIDVVALAIVSYVPCLSLSLTRFVR
jgi:hypothetical protein